MKTYSGEIEKLEPNQIFVFGSNTEGRHGMGSALWAVKNAGAVRGQAEGLQGQSYAIITKDLTKDKHPSIPATDIINSITKLYAFAAFSPDKEFLIAYSADKPNLNGYSTNEMVAMFATVESMGRRLANEIGIKFPGPPPNIIFEEGFARILEKAREFI